MPMVSPYSSNPYGVIVSSTAVPEGSTIFVNSSTFSKEDEIELRGILIKNPDIGEVTLFSGTRCTIMKPKKRTRFEERQLARKAKATW